MCGIWAIIGDSSKCKINNHVEQLKNRGPESCKIVKINDRITTGFTRLAINGLNDGGMMPLNFNNVSWICNGEIYNHIRLAQIAKYVNVSGSDCEVIGPIYKFCNKNPKQFFRSFDGVFSIVLVDLDDDKVVIGRDPYGVRPLYIGTSQTHNSIIVGSEFKSVCFDSIITKVEQFKPGFYQVYQISTGLLLEEDYYHVVPFSMVPLFTNEDLACMAVNFALKNAVKKRMMTERPVAALLSGGVDSSLIASLVQKELRALECKSLRTFSIGFEGSEDLKFASIVANYIKSDHTQIVCTPDDFFNSIKDVIRDIESFDITTVRASIGNWFISKKIKELSDSKVVFNGDGSDEVFGSYIYFFNSPNEEEYCWEVEHLLKDICYFDVLRSDRSISSHGLEARTPFLDKSFVNTVLSIHPSLRRPRFQPGSMDNRMEKLLLRKAFEKDEILPNDVLFRQKEAFSDGVSGKTKSWFQEIQERVEKLVPDDWKQKSQELGYNEHLPPTSKEAFYYRDIFHQIYPKYLAKGATPYFWMPKWCQNANDPSARTLEIYTKIK